MQRLHPHQRFAVTLAGCAILGAASSVWAGACPADLDRSGDVGFTDLLAVLSAWGPCPGCPEDLDGSGDVGFTDLLQVLSDWGACPGADLVVLEMAGVALTGYPHFDFVRAFNEGALVAIAIDPANAPSAGLPCDVYITAAKSAEAWAADPALVDVRGSAQEVTFDGTTIQDNTFLLDGSATLDADAGPDIGFGYDLVCDWNRNAVLDGGDFIDGLSDQAGFYVVHDLAALGPLAVINFTYEVTGVPAGFENQRLWFPDDIATMGELPLVVISHGNGHQYTWYGYLQKHLASYGYVVMSHQNNTMPGIETASTTTLAHTDAFLGQLASIADAALVGHLDPSRITWIGHSRGGEGVCRAYDRLFDGEYAPETYTVEDVVLVSSIAPNDYLGRLRSNPHDVHYHLLHGTADGDNGGWPDRESDAPFHVFERAEGYRQCTHVHGADHNDFNCCGFNDFVGPPGTEIGRAEAQELAKGAYLALIGHYVDGNFPARDYLWRQYETLRPLGVGADTVVDHEYIERPGDGVFVIDNFQQQPLTSVSSSGGAVVFDVTNVFEGQMDDTDGTFTWSPGDPMNGMSRGRPDDLTRGLVFDWAAGEERFLEFEVVPAARDFTQHAYLSWRACQGTRHPHTVAELADLSFTVTLRDGDGTQSSIDFSAYGAGIEEPYQRTRSGVGAGWQNEFETIRIRLSDFLHNGSGLNLDDVHALRFEFGDGFGTDRGRVAIDDIALTDDRPPG